MPRPDAGSAARAPRAPRQPVTEGNRASAPELPFNASLAMRYAFGTKPTRAAIRKALYPGCDKDLFERWIIEDEPWRFFARTEQLAPPGDWIIWLFQAGRGAGKELCVQTLIPTPTGFKRNGDLVAGDRVFDERGRLARILEAHPPRVPERAWRLRFSSGATIDAGADHLWTVTSRKSPSTASAAWWARAAAETLDTTTLAARVADGDRPTIPMPAGVRMGGEWFGPLPAYVAIVAVEPIEPKPMRCLTVDSPSRLYLAGEGMIPTHNTRSGAEWAWERVHSHPEHRLAVVAPTSNDHDRVTFGGESGLMRLVDKHPHLVRKVNQRPYWYIELMNGSMITSFTGEASERLRGPQNHSVWADEMAGMGANAKPTYDQMMFGLRLKGPHGEQPRAMLSTTPKPLLLFRQLNDRFLRGDPAVVVTRASMMDNSANLSSELIREIRSSYEGTRFGEQEIYGKLLLDIPGALWTADSFSPCTMPSLHELDRIVVAIDPSGAADKNSSSDEIGIVVAGVRYGGNRGEDRFVVLKDSTMIGSPREWAIEAVREYHDFAADRIVAEGNFGGAMVESTIKREDQNVPVRMVTASRGKAVRAEPVSALYEQGRVYHATAGENATGGGLAKLEEQLVQMTVTGYVGDGSPDRVDALVWAITDLMEARQAPVATPSSNASVSYWRPNL